MFVVIIFSYARRRSQKTEGARFIEQVVAASRQANTYFIRPASSHSAAPRPLGVNQRDITMLCRETGINRPGTRGSELLLSARYPNNEDNEYLDYNHHQVAVKFREPISVSWLQCFWAWVQTPTEMTCFILLPAVVTSQELDVSCVYDIFRFQCMEW